MNKEELRLKFLSKFGQIFGYNDMIDFFHSEIKQRDQEIADIKAKIETLEARLEAADLLLNQAVKEWSIGDYYERCVTFQSAYSEYQALKNQTPPERP